jgi:hypothetical protein
MTTAVLRAMTIPAATLAAAIAVGGLFAPAAVRAGEYCSEDGYSFTRNCSFSSMEQCKAAISGMYAACLRDPFLEDNSIATINRDAYAYSPGPIHRESSERSSAVKTNR